MSEVSVARTIDDYLKRLFPLQRSLTGRGNRETLTVLTELLPLTISEYPSGAQVYDWVVPDEWNIYDAYIEHESGKRFAEFSKNNLQMLTPNQLSSVDNFWLICYVDVCIYGDCYRDLPGEGSSSCPSFKSEIDKDFKVSSNDIEKHITEKIPSVCSRTASVQNVNSQLPQTEKLYQIYGVWFFFIDIDSNTGFQGYQVAENRELFL